MSSPSAQSQQSVFNVFVVHQVIAIALGLMAAISKSSGYTGFAIYFSGSSMLSKYALRSVFGADQYNYEDALKTHIMPGMSTFLLAWIFTYNML
ncbi:hypothetical protein MP228_009518 [Amoeboaphelidium protococcarum]|nr:hypothetical protein MP228_009518 [Amoeboaphelidium protococcarum]